ncbi:MAG TPA: 50S ribosomal protein L4 [Tenericutes bacterium]|jgi:large subunit ribosomal protein L4|nr:50S ribosomal protein L4 [Mycoplasmatota bacterium]
MPKVAVYNQKGEKVEEINLNEEIWGVEVNKETLYDAIVMQRASLRQGTHKTKTRGEVSGGGKKPWRQKGTGRARHGSIRSPIWRGGGVVFGPQPRDYGYNINRKQRRIALISALSAIVNNKGLVVVDDLNLSTPKTKEMKKVLNNLNINDKKILMLTNEENENTILAARNIPGVKILETKGINVLDLVNHDFLLVAKDDIKAIEEVLT